MCGLLLWSRVWVFETPWTVARQAPLPLAFPRQEYLEWDVNFRIILSLHTHTHTHTIPFHCWCWHFVSFLSFDLSVLLDICRFCSSFQRSISLKNFFNLWTYFWLSLHCCAQTFSSCGERGLLSSCTVQPSHCGLQALVLHSTWDLPRSRIESVSPALAGGFFTTEPPGKPLKEVVLGTSLVIQWIRIFLLMQETWVRYLVGKDSTYHGVTN